MKLEIKTNFSFNKLSQNLPKIIEGVVQESSKDTARNAREYIKAGKVTPDIEKITRKRRKRRGNPEQPPLMETGRLVKSIKQVKDGVEMLTYGSYHQFGEGQKVRQFIFPNITKQTIANFFNQIKRAMRK